MDAIQDVEIRAGIFRAHPKSLDEAIRAALETESFVNAERQRNQGGRQDQNERQFRQVETVTGEEFERETRAMAEQLQILHVMISRFTRATSVEKWQR